MPTQSLLEACEVGWWTPMPRRSPPTVQETQIALRREEFTVRETRNNRTVVVDLAQEIPWTSAVRRAVGNLENKDLKASFRTEGAVLHAQLDRLSLDDNGRQVRTLEARWKLEGGERPRFLHMEGSSPIADLSLASWRTYYQWGDVSTIIMQVIAKHGFGAYSIRKAGGVYFIPVRNRELLDRLERACAEINLNFLRLPIPDSEAHRGEIEEAIFTALEAEIQVHVDAIADYREDTKMGHITNREAAIADTRRLVENLGGHLRSRRTDLIRQIEAAVTALNAKKAVVEQQLNQPRAVGGGRRNIMVTRS